MKSLASGSLADRLPHWLALVLVCVTFPLIWVGGLVTTYDAGMAVPDWPGTYGHNLLLYPWSTWFAGPWDLFIEHGHRLLGAASGLLTVALALAVCLADRRRWLGFVVFIAILGVVAQGVLGGLRVLMDSGRLAMVHGCTGPLFFAVCVALAVFTSSTWKNASIQTSHPRATFLHWLAGAAVGVSAIQLVLGALLRHLPVTASPHTFRLAVFLHLLVAALLIAHVVWLAIGIRRIHSGHVALRRPAFALVGLVCVQLLLGAGTWIAKYAWPRWLLDFELSAGLTVQAEGMAQVLTVTAHVATGTLILGTGVVLALRCARLVRPVPELVPSGSNP